jgi:ElaB/YqjD/DUF883 family membrane-anchored ribosome-binding protein
MRKAKTLRSENVRELNKETTATGDNIRKAGHKLHSWSAKTGNAADKLIHTTNEYSGEMVNYVKKHPVGTVLVVGAASFITGWLFLRR